MSSKTFRVPDLGHSCLSVGRCLAFNRIGVIRVVPGGTLQQE